MKNDDTKVILARIGDVQGVVDRVDRDLAQDRHELQELTLRVGALEGEIHQLKDNIARMPVRVGDQVQDAVKPVTKETHDLKKVIEGKKVMRMWIKGRGWRFWQRR